MLLFTIRINTILNYSIKTKVIWVIIIFFIIFIYNFLICIIVIRTIIEILINSVKLFHE